MRFHCNGWHRVGFRDYTTGMKTELSFMRTQLRRLGVIAIAAAGVGGCMSMTSGKMDQVMNSWIGHSANDLIGVWGRPSRIANDTNGDRMLIYDESSQVVWPGDEEQDPGWRLNSTTSYASSELIVYTKERIFWVNRNSTIYRCQWKGLTAADRGRGYPSMP